MDIEISAENSAVRSYEERKNTDEEGELERDSRTLKENSAFISSEERQKEEGDKKLRQDVGISEE
jgi:hypothetical protein